MKRPLRYRSEAFASFLVVGLGQIIKGEGKKGLEFLLAFYFVLPVIIYASLLISAYLFLMVLGFALLFEIFLWGYNVWEAYTHEAIV